MSIGIFIILMEGIVYFRQSRLENAINFALFKAANLQSNSENKFN